MNVQMSIRSVAAASLLIAAPALAQDDAGPQVNISGFVDTSLYIPFDDTSEWSIGLDQVELDFEASPHSTVDIRMDLNVFPSAAPPAADDLVEQGYLTYSPSAVEGFSITAGKWNAPIGVEYLDPIDMYQYSYGLLFTHATPSNLTGLNLGYEVGDITIMLFGTNDWDTPRSSDNFMTGGRVAWAANDTSLGLSTTYGPIVEDVDGQLMLDVDFIQGFGDTTVMAEFNYGSLGDLSGIGALLKLNQAFGNHSVTGRFSYLDSEYLNDGIKQWETTLALLLGVADGFGTVIELRYDNMPDLEEDAIGAAIELTASF